MENDITKFKKEIGYELKTFRDRCDLTIEKVANITGVATSTISRYENGTIRISLDVLKKIINAYDINLFIFFKEVIAKLQEDKEE